MSTPPTLWMIIEKKAKTPVFVQLIDAELEILLGPFFYTKEEDASIAIEEHLYFSKSQGKEGNFISEEVESKEILYGIVEGFNPAESDVFSINDEVLPLTPEGALFVDNLTGSDHWMPLFMKQDHYEISSGDKFPKYLKLVLNSVSKHLGTKDIKPLGLGEAPESTFSQIKKLVKCNIVPETGVAYGILPQSTTFKIRTSGLGFFNRPDLQLENIPALFVEDASILLMEWVEHSIRQPFKIGDVIQGSSEPVYSSIIIKEISEDPPLLLLGPHEVIFTNLISSQAIN